MEVAFRRRARAIAAKMSREARQFGSPVPGVGVNGRNAIVLGTRLAVASQVNLMKAGVEEPRDSGNGGAVGRGESVPPHGEVGVVGGLACVREKVR